MSVNSIKKFILFVFILLLFSDPMNAQCSMCRAVLESEEGQQTAKGINDGIIYLMAIPYILVALASWRIYKIYRK
ncbi:MAG: hypothetical protein CMC21_00780 [Flavobacteriaceae bacterium]|nr:hypothetical protein [Flavobacteriaceae bacterium]|tara:strand:+ start:711 stop:935 length:225 start_codon:yes stop_codon:yes gene_type:complete